MKPFKSGNPIATWMLRIALFSLLFHIYFNPVSTLNFGNITFYLGLSMLLGGVLVIIGGLFSKPGLTIISGLVLFCISLYKIILSFNGIIDSYISIHLITMSLGFFFFTNGNEN
jgi:hypothetical protein